MNQHHPWGTTTWQHLSPTGPATHLASCRRDGFDVSFIDLSWTPKSSGLFRVLEQKLYRMINKNLRFATCTCAYFQVTSMMFQIVQSRDWNWSGTLQHTWPRDNVDARPIPQVGDVFNSWTKWQATFHDAKLGAVTVSNGPWGSYINRLRFYRNRRGIVNSQGVVTYGWLNPLSHFY